MARTSTLLVTALMALGAAGAARGQPRVPALDVAQNTSPTSLLPPQAQPVRPPQLAPAQAEPPPPAEPPAANQVAAPQQPQFPRRAPPPLNPISQQRVRLTGKEVKGVAVAHDWQHRVSMPAPGADGAVTFEYGATQPSIVCAPLEICMLKLQPGETVLPGGLQAGDTVRWSITPGVTGTGAAQQTVVVIKPTDAGLRTTLGILTNKRVYSIALVSTQAQYMPVAQFAYPEDQQAQWASYYKQEQEQKAATTLPGGLNTANLDFNYSISGDSPSWRPLRVYTDGQKTYIQFPPSASSSEAPALLALARDGSWFSEPSKQLVNYRKVADTYVVDKVLDRAVLIVGVGSGQSKVTIEHAR